MRGLCAAGRADVYNLSVEDTEEYFANGLLVHNCRYLLMSVGTAPSVIFDRDEDTAAITQIGRYGFNAADLHVPGTVPIPGETPGVAAPTGNGSHGAAKNWSQV